MCGPGSPPQTSESWGLIAKAALTRFWNIWRWVCPRWFRTYRRIENLWAADFLLPATLGNWQSAFLSFGIRQSYGMTWAVPRDNLQVRFGKPRFPHVSSVWHHA